MKFLSCFVALGLFVGVSIAQNSTVQIAHVTLRSEGDDHSFPLNVPANGKPVFTYSTLPVQLIDAPDYDVLQLCAIQTVGPANLSSTIASDGVTQQVVIDPPQTVTSITCQGTCVETWGPSISHEEAESYEAIYMVDF
ncbi:hypothetical protein ACSS6W_000341 [Trichoderma asperelloides]|uniref:Uncharacterized protein n=1 Tax=Trichoderma asperellum TaxID=101201 RepID=A0A6V8QKA7_TRIAP|nr:hypothetical protein LI328DRAFT_142588 [Trichoderma asperelloides]GFP52921.1 hypothetical protein TASIC1_0002010500 [Trichoderma asperellum]